MRILFVNLQAYLPQVMGGVETSTFQLARHLNGIGNETAVMCGLEKRDAVWLKNRLMSRITRRGFPAERYQGSLVYRGYEHVAGLPQVCADFKPDVLVVSGGTDGTLALAAQCTSAGLPTFHYFHDIASVRRLKAPPRLDGLSFLANSSYTADQVRELLGVTATPIPPFVAQHEYRTETTRQYVTMINPRKIKGGQRMLDLARACPDIPFLVIEAWTGEDAFVTGLRNEASQLPNVTWRPPTSDMRSVYAVTRILLVPSEWEETWGRVVTEAHASGIPALATARAALPESVGPGGVLVDATAPSAAWQTALRSMWDDTARYESLSAAAKEYSERGSVSPAHIAERFISTLRSRCPP